MQGFTDIKWHRLTVSQEGVTKLGAEYWQPMLGALTPFNTFVTILRATFAEHPPVTLIEARRPAPRKMTTL